MNFIKITILYLFGIILLSSFTNAALSEGVIGNWNFDSSYSDSLGAHNAINNGGAFFIPGKFGDAINFTGVAGSSLEIPYFNLTNYNTICAWQLTKNHAITLAQGVSSSMRHHLVAGPTNAFAYSALPYSPYDNNPYTYTYPSGITPSDGNWHFFCWVNNNDWAYRTKLYIDGTYIGQVSARVTFPWLTSNYWLGKYQEGSIVKYYAYSIDELTIWNRILNQTEIITLYNNGIGLQYPFNTTINESLYNVTFPYPNGYYLNQSTLTYGFTTTDPNYNYTIWNVTTISGLNDTICYQEFANVSTACGGLSTGGYYVDLLTSPENCYDGDYSSYCWMQAYGTGYLYINYTKPYGANIHSLWQIKASNTISNVSIPLQCWDYDINTLLLRISSNSGAGGADAQCYNGTTWITLLDTSSNQWIYEEAMFWQIGGGIVLTNDTQITYNLADGKYYYGLTIFDQEGNSKHYGSNIIIDTTPPMISFGGGTPLNGSYLSSNSIFVNASVVEENFNNMSIFLYTDFDEISSVLSTNFTAYSSGPYNITSSFSNLSDGTYYINATAYDLAGNSNSTETRTITLDYYADNVSISAYEKMTNNTIPFNLYLTNSTGGIVYNFSSTNRTLDLNDKMARGYNYTVILNTTYDLGGYNTCTYNWTATDNYVFPECVFYNHRLNITAYNSYTGQAINIFNTTLIENTTTYTESQNTTNRTINYYILQGLNYSITLHPDAHFNRNITYAAATPTGTLNLSVNQSIITLNFIHAFTQQLINNANITLNDTNYTGKIFNTSNGIIVFNPNAGTHNLKITSPRYVVRTHNLTVTDQDIRTINITLYPILNLSIYDEKLSGITPTYFNFSKPTQIKHTIYCSSNTTETKIISNTTPSGPYLLNTTCKMIKLRFDLEYSGIGGTTEYHRIIMPSPTINDFDFKVFIPDLSLPTSILQTFLEPNDIAGRYTLEKGTILRVTKLMPTGTEVMIEDFMDAEGKITAYLIQGDSYILTVLAEGVPAKVVGIYNADSAGTKTLRLYNVGLIDPTLIGSTPTHTSLTDVRFYNLTENQSLLTMSYKDEGEFTNQLIMTIYNGSCNYKKNILIQSILERPDLILANFSAETSYNIFGSRYQNGSSNQMFCSVWNVTYSDGLTAHREETMIYDSWIPRPGIFTNPWTFPWIVMLILTTIALGLNARTVSLGSLLIMVLAGIMFAWNWVQAGTPGVKTFVVFGLALLIAIGLAFKRNVI